MNKFLITIKVINVAMNAIVKTLWFKKRYSARFENVNIEKIIPINKGIMNPRFNLFFSNLLNEIKEFIIWFNGLNKS